jgi:hypothetical protein
VCFFKCDNFHRYNEAALENKVAREAMLRSANAAAEHAVNTRDEAEVGPQALGV